MEGTEKTFITVETRVKAPVEQVWECWTDARQVTRWNNASPDWHTPVAENDLRPGGKFLYRMEARDGSFGFDFTGIYDELIENRLIRFTMGDGRRVMVSFAIEGEETHVEESFEAETENPVEMQRTGWQNILDNFKEYVEGK